MNAIQHNIMLNNASKLMLNVTVLRCLQSYVTTQRLGRFAVLKDSTPPTKPAVQTTLSAFLVIGRASHVQLASCTALTRCPASQTPGPLTAAIDV